MYCVKKYSKYYPSTHEETSNEYYRNDIFKKTLLRLHLDDDFKSDEYHEKVYQFMKDFYHFIPSPFTLEWLFEIANDSEDENSFAQYWIGHLYMNGYGVSHDKNTAMDWFQSSWKNNNPYALNYIALLHESNKKEMNDVKKVRNMIEMFKESAVKGTDFAKYNLAKLCFDNQKYKETIAIYKNIGLNRIDTRLAKYHLHQIYKYGLGNTKINNKIAQIWLAKI